MTMMVHYVFELDGCEDWVGWGDDATEHGLLLGEVSLMDARYGPPDWLPKGIAPAWGMTIVEMDHAALARLAGTETEIRGRLGSGQPGRGVGKKIGELDPRKRYALVWLEVG